MSATASELLQLLLLIGYGELRQWAARHGRAVLLDRIELVAQRTAVLINERSPQKSTEAAVAPHPDPGGPPGGVQSSSPATTTIGVPADASERP